MKNTGIHKIQGGNKRVFKSIKCPEYPFHDKCTENSKYCVFQESTQPLNFRNEKKLHSSY